MNKNVIILLFLFRICSFGDEQRFVFVDPLDCLTPQRVDVLAKYIYAKNYSLDVNSLWHFDLYKRHLEVWNPALVETDGIVVYKSGMDDYIDSFHNTIESISSCYSPNTSCVPIAFPSYNLLDGAHRAGSALAMNKLLVCELFYQKPAFNITFDYFKSVGLDEKYLDAMALQYAFLKKQTYMVNIFPIAMGHTQKVEKILSDSGDVIYKKDIYFKNDGPFLFMKSLYEGQEWIGSESDGYQAIADKTQICFPSNVSAPMKVYLFEAKNLSSVVAMKKRIRDVFGLGHYSVHINDTHKETREEAKIIFNKNSIHCLNNKQKKDFPAFSKFLLEYRRWLKRYCLDEEQFCVDGSSVLAVYGLREAGDLDFLYHGDPASLPPCKEYFDEHSGELKYHSTTKDDIIFNPDNHFYYKGVKFASLETIKRMKKNRAEQPKDNNDLKLIALLLQKNNLS